MQSALHRAGIVAGLLVAAALTPAAGAQTTVRVVISGSTVYVSGVGGTTVRVPDGGTAMVGGYSAAAESRSEYGAPVLSKVPYADRAIRNVTHGRATVSGRVTVSARIIDLREEEFRQTGFRSP